MSSDPRRPLVGHPDPPGRQYGGLSAEQLRGMVRRFGPESAVPEGQVATQYGGLSAEQLRGMARRFGPEPPIPEGHVATRYGSRPKYDPIDWSKDSAIVTELVARAIDWSGFGPGYRGTKNIVEYGFRKPETAADRKAILEWMADPRASYAEMPPGALRYEIGLALLPIIGGIQAARDVTRDLYNDDVSGWTYFDALSIPLEFMPAIPALLGLLRHAGDYRNMGKMWRAVEDLRKANPDLPVEELADLVRAQGFTEEQTTRLLRLERNPAPLLERAGHDADYLLEGLPESERRMYHVTTNRDAVYESGRLKSRGELIPGNLSPGQMASYRGTGGLGGGPTNTASVTYHPGHAQLVEDRMRVAVKAARGDMDAKDVLEYFKHELAEAGLDFEPHALMENWESVSVHYGFSDFFEAAKAKLGRIPTDDEMVDMFDDWLVEAYAHNPYALVQDYDASMGALADLYGGDDVMPSKVGFLASRDAMAKVDPDQIGIVEVLAPEDAVVDVIHPEAEIRVKPEETVVVPRDPGSDAARRMPYPDERVTGVTLKRGDDVVTGPPGMTHTVLAAREGWDLADPAVTGGFATNRAPFVSRELAQDVMEAAGQTRVRLPSGRAVSEQLALSEGKAVSPVAERNIENAPRIEDYEDPNSYASKAAEAERAAQARRATRQRARAMMEEYGIPPEKAGAEPAHWGEIRKTAQGTGEADLDRMAQVQADMVERGRPYGEVAKARPRRGVTDWDRAVARRHNEAVDAAETLEDNYDIGSTTARAGGDPAERHIVSPEKRWETPLDATEGHITPEQVAAFRERYADDLTEGRYIGTWYDPNSGKVTLDISEGYDDAEMARHVAQAGEQQGFFDRMAPEGEGFQAVSQHVGDQARSRLHLDDTIPERTAARRERLLEYMTPEERAYYDSRPDAEKLKMEQAMSIMPTPEEGASYVQMGAEGRAFYPESLRGFTESFGRDAPQFAVLASATSPNTPIESNLAGALALWDEWDAAGRPTDPDAIEALFRQFAVPEGITTTNRNNVVKVLSETDTDLFLDPDFLKSDYLGGLKVNPFYSNLLGDTQRITIDTHGLKEPVSKALTKGRRVGISAATRESAPAVAERLGETLTPAEIQASRWNLIKAMGEEVGHTGSVEDFFFPGGELDPARLAALQSRMASPVDYSVLMNQPEMLRRLELMGVDAPRPSPRVPPARGAQEPNLEHLRRLAQRLDMSRRGDYLYGLGGAGLLGGYAARQGLLGGEPQGEGGPALLRGQGLLGI